MSKVQNVVANQETEKLLDQLTKTFSKEYLHDYILLHVHQQSKRVYSSKQQKIAKIAIEKLYTLFNVKVPRIIVALGATEFNNNLKQCHNSKEDDFMYSIITSLCGDVTKLMNNHLTTNKNTINFFDIINAPITDDNVSWNETIKILINFLDSYEEIKKNDTYFPILTNTIEILLQFLVDHQDIYNPDQTLLDKVQTFLAISNNLFGFLLTSKTVYTLALPAVFSLDDNLLLHNSNGPAFIFLSKAVKNTDHLTDVIKTLIAKNGAKKDEIFAIHGLIEHAKEIVEHKYDLSYIKKFMDDWELIVCNEAEADVYFSGFDYRKLLSLVSFELINVGTKEYYYLNKENKYEEVREHFVDRYHHKVFEVCNKVFKYEDNFYLLYYDFHAQEYILRSCTKEVEKYGASADLLAALQRNIIFIYS